MRVALTKSGVPLVAALAFWQAYPRGTWLIQNSAIFKRNRRHTIVPHLRIRLQIKMNKVGIA
jgi:hypothetical protein